jgi:hypothetical protein
VRAQRRTAGNAKARRRKELIPPFTDCSLFLFFSAPSRLCVSVLETLMLSMIGKAGGGGMEVVGSLEFRVHEFKGIATSHVN